MKPLRKYAFLLFAAFASSLASSQAAGIVRRVDSPEEEWRTPSRAPAIDEAEGDDSDASSSAKEMGKKKKKKKKKSSAS